MRDLSVAAVIIIKVVTVLLHVPSGGPKDWRRRGGAGYGEKCIGEGCWVAGSLCGSMFGSAWFLSALIIIIIIIIISPLSLSLSHSHSFSWIVLSHTRWFKRKSNRERARERAHVCA